MSTQVIVASLTNIQEVVKATPSQNYTQIHELIGMASYYCWFIKNFSLISQPLQEYSKGEGAKQKKEVVKLSPEALKGFKQLNHALTKAPVLAYASFSLPFLLETDMSQEGLGIIVSWLVCES